ncbi:MAG: acyl carrier protein [Steroidobacteraceae bacterium]
MTTLERLAKILEERYHVDPHRIALDEPIEELGLDSLGMTELLFFIEEEFAISLPYEPVSMRTVGDAVRYIDEVLAAHPPGAAQPPTAGAHPATAGTVRPAPDVALQASQERPA